MRNKRVAIGLAVFNAVAASVSLMPASFAQETPPGGGGIAPSAPPPSVQTITPTQPNPMQQMMQNAIQQQQLMNQINQSFFNPFINANPSVSPMDQRSGTTNNASSVNAGSKPIQSLGISSTSAPNISNTSISGSGGSQPVNDPSKLGQLMVLGSKGQPVNLTLNDLAGFNAETLLGAILNFAVGNGAQSNQINADDLNKLKMALAQSGVSIENFRDVFAQIVIGVASGQISPEMVNNFVTALGQGQGTSLQTISARMQEAAQKVREAQTSKPSGTSGSSASSSATSNAAFMSALAPLLGALGSASSASGVARAGTSTVQSTAQTTAQTTQSSMPSATSSVASGVTSVMSSLFGSSSSGSLSAKPTGTTTTATGGTSGTGGATITMISSAPRTGSTGMQTSIGGVSSSGGISKPSGTGYMNLGQSSSTSSSSSASAPAAAPAPTKPPAAVTATSSAITSVVNTNFPPQINSALASVSSALRSLFKKFP